MEISKGAMVVYQGRIYTVIRIYDNGFCKIGIEKNSCYIDITNRVEGK
jgi:hypothetical protein